VSDNTIAWVFPGQGSQEVGMGKDLFDAFDSARVMYARADETLGRGISKLSFEGPADELSKTFNAQPAIFLMSMVCLTVARETGQLSDDARFAAGHSLGEYSALCAAGALSFDDGLRLVETRGKVTQAAADQTPGGMAAILGLDEDAALAVCAESGAELCNINAPGQIVIGGATEAVARACELARERGAKRAIPLDVGGGFHTSLMGAAVPAFEAALEEAAMKAPVISVVANDTAEPMSDPNRIRRELAFQLTHPVRWVQCVEYMAANGVTEFVEIGPGKVLTGLIKRISPASTLRNINGAGALSV
jgi:[acyl-carrier-protein] S-malonyltransferase